MILFLGDENLQHFGEYSLPHSLHLNSLTMGKLSLVKMTSVLEGFFGFLDWFE